jgi:uncharacterized membrane protein (UPF0127 family)
MKLPHKNTFKLAMAACFLAIGMGLSYAQSAKDMAEPTEKVITHANQGSDLVKALNEIGIDFDYALAKTIPLTVTKKNGQKVQFNVEVVESMEDMARGLMYRKSMPSDHGMLFKFSAEGERGFWMRNTLIPLDIIFINPEGAILNIGYGQPLNEEAVTSSGVALNVLELNHGTASKLGISPGDKISF